MEDILSSLPEAKCIVNKTKDKQQWMVVRMASCSTEVGTGVFKRAETAKTGWSTFAQG